MATEALRRLREDIDAAFEAQRRPSNERRVVETSPKTSTPKWAGVTALLASVGRPAVQKATSDATQRASSPLRPVKGIFTDEQMQQLTASERQMLLHKFMEIWRRTAHAAAVVTRLHIRSRKRRQQRLADVVFTAWRRRCFYQLKLRKAANFVEKQVKVTDKAEMWRRWTRAHCRALQLRALCAKRRRRLSYEAFCSWVLGASQRARFRRNNQKAATLLLQRYWRWLKAAIETQRMINVEVKHFIERRIVDLTGRWFMLWVEYIEQRRRWQFAARWSDRRILGDAYDTWRENHEDTRRVRHILQLTTRRQRRRKLREVLNVWSTHAQRALKQKRALVVVLHAQQLRNTFVRLVINARCDRERERSLQKWKIRRAVWIWLHRSHRDRMLRLRAEFLKENHERSMLRTAVWYPWRRKYQCSVALRKFTAKQQAKQVRKYWMAFALAVNQQEQQRLMIERIAVTREVRELRRAISAWRGQTRYSREFTKLTAKSAAFYQRGLLKRAVWGWKAAHQVACVEKSLNATAVGHLARKMVQHWAKWAYWSRRELGRRIAVVKEQRRRIQVQRCLVHWRAMVCARHRALYSESFNAWKVAIDVQHRQRQLVELRRLIQLRWRWQRWELLALQCQDLRAKAHEAQKLREQRLRRYSLVTVWLRKTRRYKLGANTLALLAMQHTLSYALTRWRQNQLRLSAVRLASEFCRKKLQAHYLRLLFGLTIGHKRTAIAYDRRRRLVGSWGRWHRHFTARRRRHEADVYFRRRAKQKAVHLLHVAAAHSIASRHQRLDTEAWHEAVVLQRVLSNWFVAARHARRCRSLGECLGWNGVGRRAFRVWQDGWVEKQKLLRAAEFHSSVLVTRSWNALLRVTKRRQVALAMWSHSMMRIRLGDVFMNWKRFVDGRRGQYAVAASMYRMQEHRTRQRLFTAWALLGTSRMMALRREQSELIRWRQACWAHWKLWRVSRRWQRSQQLTLLRKSFSRGLQRYAIQQQARREICAQTARNLLQRSLAQWRVEWWLVRNQKKATTEAKRNALTHWKTFVVACRQKRRWEHYVQHLHRSETRTAFDQKRRANGDTFRDSRALQAQLKRSRVLMTHVLHAWYLVVQNRRRRTQTRALAMARKSRRSPMRPRQIALEFWARRVMGTCFSSWREQAVGQAERKLFG